MLADRKTFRGGLFLWLALVVWLWLPVGAAGQVVPGGSGGPEAAAAVELPEDLTQDQVRELISRLSDEDARQLLIRQLDKVAAKDAAEQVEAAGLVDSFEDALHLARARLSQVVTAIPRLPTVGPIIFGQLSEGRSSAFTLLVLLVKLVIFAAGGLVEWLFRRMFSQFGEHQGQAEAQGVVDKLCILSMRLIRDLMALAVFGLVVTGLFFVFYEGHEATRELFTAVLGVVMLIRLISIVGRFVLAPNAPSLRVPPIDDASAHKQHRRILLIAGVLIVGISFMQFYTSLASQTPDPDPSLQMALGLIIGAIILGLIIVMIWLDRATISQMILSGSESEEQPAGRVREVLASNWHIFATCIIIAIYLTAIFRRLLTGESQAGPIVVSLIVILGAPILDWIIGASLSALFRIKESAEGAAEAPADGGEAGLDHEQAEAAERSARRALEARMAIRDVLVRNLRIILAVVIVLFLTKIWNIDLRGVAAGGVGEAVAGALFDIVITLILASAVWGTLKVAIRYAVPEDGEQGEVGEGEGGGQSGSRLQTLVPLLGRFLLITLAVIVTLIVLSELGVDIGPLIAGAGVIGIAIGFGAQTLVKDIISGVFFLADDAFRVGEYIDVGDVMGTVEHISIRSLRLRHHRGPVHTIPFGEIRHLTNFSRDWAIMKIEFRLPFDADLEKVRKIIKKVGQTLMADPVHGPNFLQPVKSQGVHRMDDSAFIIRVKFMTKPGEQFTLRREVFSKIQEAFAKAGIHFAPRRVIVESGAGQEEAAAGAAAEAEAQQT
jgi:small-conductance mechanosensitive channel